MLSNEEKIIVKQIVIESLIQAETHWKDGGYLLDNMNKSMAFTEARAESEPSKIPGHPIVQDQVTIIDEYIALVADMRDSSKHLMSAISSKTAEVSGLQRVYYETSALLPAIAKTVNYKNGNVTEYLGDGVLALFKVNKNDKEETIRESYQAAKNIIGDTREIVNNVLYERYSLPDINLGVGLSISKTLITLIGLKGEKHPKAFGECVFRATKLSSGNNRIHTDEFLHSLWPSSKGGKINFRAKEFGSLKGYLVTSEK